MLSTKYTKASFRFIAIGLMLCTLLVFAGCGSDAAPEKSEPAKAPAAKAPTAKAPAAKAPAAKAPAAKVPAAKPSLFEIADAKIDPDRSRVPEGKVTIGVHVTVSPDWMNPQTVTSSLMPYELMWKVQDSMLKPSEQSVFTYSLAESFDMTDDFMSVEMRLRDGVTFHDGSLITIDDVIFSYENYHGANATFLHDKTKTVEAVDDRTVKLTFNSPFPDFIFYYATPASGAGIIIPKDYYLSLGSDNASRDQGYVAAPIGAGPYKFAEAEAGVQVKFEAYEDYWRKVPHVKTLISRGIRELPVRVAALKTGEADFVYFVTGELLQSVIDDPELQYDPNNSAPFWLMFPDRNDPESPFNDARVRKAISLAMDRDWLAEQETLGMAVPTGNFIPYSWPGASQRDPDKYDVAEAKRLMAEAGYEDGFEIDWFTPFPAVESLSLRIMDQLAEIGIKAEMQVMERPIYYEKLRSGIEDDKMSHKGFPGRQIVMSISVLAGSAAGYIDTFATCDGNNSLICDDRIEALWSKYQEIYDPTEREQLMLEAQDILHEEHMMIPIYINAFTMGVGPNIAGSASDYTSVKMSVLAGPNEDFKLK